MRLNRMDLVKEVAAEADVPNYIVNEVSFALEYVLTKHIMACDTVQLFSGVAVSGELSKPRVKDHPKTHEKIVVEPRIYPKLKTTYAYRKKVNADD